MSDSKRATNVSGAVVWCGLVAMLACSLSGAPREAALLASAPPEIAENLPPAPVKLEPLNRQPTRFEENRGQVDGRVRYVARRGGASLFLTDSGATLALHAPGVAEGANATEARRVAMTKSPDQEGPREPDAVITLSVTGGRAVKPVADRQLVSKTNYFIGSDPKKWQRDVPNYERVKYAGVLDGVDLVYHGEDGQLEYDFVVAPGADPRSITLEVGGARGLSLTKDGALSIRTPRGELTQPRPRVFQRDDAGRERDVAAGYRLVGTHHVAFEVNDFDRSRPLVIDPVVSYAALVGGALVEENFWGNGLAVDASGNAYVGGRSTSTDFPVANPSGSYNAFVTKLGPTGTLIYTTYVGGANNEYGTGVALDNAGDPYICGYTNSTDLPIKKNSLAGQHDAFVTRFNASGGVVYSTYIGGSEHDVPFGMAFDASNNVHVAGYTESPNLAAAKNTYTPGNVDAFTAIVTTAGSVLQSTYVGGTGEDTATGIGVDSNGDTLLTGYSSSTNLPSPKNLPAGSQDAFVVKVNAAGAIVYSTYVGGSSFDTAWGLALTSDDTAVISGATTSGNLPAALNSAKAANNAFVAKIGSTGNVLFSRYIGGSSGNTSGFSIALDSTDNIFTSGSTASPDFLASGKSHDASQDAFVAKLTPSGAVSYAYRFGGTNSDDATAGLKLDGAGHVYVAGNTGSADFPKTVGQSLKGSRDLFVVKLTEDFLSLSSAPAKVAPGQTVTFTAAGGTPPYVFSLTGGSTGSLTPSGATVSYTAGSTGGAAGTTDTLKVTDAYSNEVTVAIVVSPTLSVTAGSSNLPVSGTTTLTVAGGSETGYAVSGTPSCGTVSPTANPKVFGYTATAPTCSGSISFKDSLNQTASVPMTVGAALAITNAPATAPPRKSVTLGTAGGVPGTITWGFDNDVSASGGKITSEGVYTAGNTGSVIDKITAKDAANNVASVQITVTAAVTITSATSTAPLGTIALTATGGSNTGFSWQITSTPTNGTITGSSYKAKSAGLVNDAVKVIDDLGNVATTTISVTAALAIAAPTSVTVPPRGTATFTAKNGAGGYAFTVGAPAHGTITTAGAIGSYTAGGTPDVNDTITVKDSNTAAATASIHVGPGITISATATDLLPNQQISLTATGGSGSFAISKWTLASGGSNGVLIAAADGTSTFKAGTAGGATGTSDSITVEDTLGNTKSIVLGVGGGLVIDQGSAISTTPRGSITFTAHGGDTTHGYTWTLLSTPTPPTGTITTGGVYKAGNVGSVTDKVRVKDNLGAIADIEVSIGPSISISSTPASLSVAPLGKLDFNPSGGSNSGFSWTLEKHSGADAVIDAATGDYKAGSVGSNTDVVHVTDDLGNTASVNVTVTAPLALSSNLAKVPPRGGAIFTASAGQAPYTFAIRTSASGAPNVTTTGAYTAGINPSVTDVVEVTDANHVTVAVSISIGPGVSITPGAPSVPPLGGIALAASGGSGTGFVWSVAVNASGGSIDPASGDFVAGSKDLSVDQVKVVDSLGNFALINVSVGDGIAINPAGALASPRSTVKFIAVGGSNAGFVWSFLANASGGAIDPATGQYKAGATANVTDRIRITDSLGNVASVDVTVGAGLTINPSTASVAPGARLKFYAAGGSGDAITFKLTGNGSGGTITSDGQYQAGGAGNSSDVVEVTDSLGNSAHASIGVGAGLSVSPLSASVSPGGKQSFIALGGAGGYVFSFQSNASGGTMSSSGAYVAGRTPDVTDVVRVTDLSGAIVRMSIRVGAGVTIAPKSAAIAPLGTVIFSATGGSGADFVWSLSKNGSGATIGTSDGSYRAGANSTTFDTVLVTDSLGNTATANISVGGGITISPPSASVAPRGALPFKAEGGAGGFRWSIATNASGATIDPASGAYVAGEVGGVTDVVQVADAGGLTLTASVSVTAGLRITPEAASTAPSTQVTFSVTGGSGTSITWAVSNNLSGGSVDGNGIYTAGGTANVTDTLTATDSLGNTAQAFVAVTFDGQAPNTPLPGSPSPEGAAAGSAGPAEDDGCSSSGSSPGGFLPILAALAAAMRRRRRREMV